MRRIASWQVPISSLAAFAASLLAVAICLPSPSRAADFTSTWNGTTGNWSDATRWSSNPLFPDNGNGGFTFDAAVNSGSVTVDQAILIENLNFGGGTVGGANTLTAQGAGSTWTGGTISNSSSVKIDAGGAVSLSGSSVKTLTAGTLSVEGTATWTGAGNINGSSASLSTINVLSGGLFDIQNDASMIGVTIGGHSFNNAGTFRKSAGAGTTTISGWTIHNTGAVEINSGTLITLAAGTPFNNTGGTVQINSGTLSLGGGGTSTGSFSTVAGTTLAFAGGTHNLTGASFTNAGEISFSGATANFNDPITLAGTVNISSGAVNFNATSTLSGPVAWSSGTVGGTGQKTFDNLAWTGGTLTGAGGALIPASQSASISGSSVKNLSGTTLTIGGTVNWTGTGDINASNNTLSTMSILVGGLFDAQNDEPITFSVTSGHTLNNAGTFRKSAGAGTTTISGWTINNTGTVEVNAGILSLSSGGTSTGSFSTAAGAGLHFAGGTHNLTGASFTNAGEINFSGATANFNDPITLAGTVNISSGTVNFNAASTLSGPVSLGGTVGGSGQKSFDNLTWTGGTLSGSGAALIPAGQLGLLTGNTFSKSLNGATLSIGGTMNWTGTRDISAISTNPSTMNILSGGLVDAQNNQNITFSGTSGHALNNAGTLRKSIGGGTTTITGWVLNNTGAVEVEAGTLSLTSFSPVMQLSGTTLTGGTWKVGPGATLSIGTGSNITTNQGNVTLDGVGSTFAKINSLSNNQGGFSVSGGRNFTTAGALANSGDVTVGAGSTLTIGGGNAYTQTAGTTQVDGDLVASVLNLTGGTLQGTGTITGPVNLVGTSLAPGNSIGTLGIAGNLTFGAGSSFDVEINLGQADQLNIIGDLDLSGLFDSINITPLDGAYSSLGKFVLITYTGNRIGNGVFENAFYAGLPLPQGEYAYLDYSTPGQVTLTVVPEPSTLLLAILGLLAMSCIA